MCGICGYFSDSNVFSREDLEKMTSSLAHRGPDAEGFFQYENIGMGHRRLSIIDLSSSANQPMTSHNGRYVMVYNGEVYNFKEIKSQIPIPIAIGTKSQEIMKTFSDSEVVLEAFALWGPEFVHKLNGMFVIAIYDKEEKAFYFFRDRIGIKPLYYFWDGKNFAFASELKALKKCNYINKNISLNITALNEYLHLGYVPEPHSIYNNIYKFPAGSWAKLTNSSGNGSQFTDDSSMFNVQCSMFNVQSSSSSFTIHKYWSIDEKIYDKLITDEHEAKEKLKELLISSVKYRMISDVPFGTFLSGGIDSSLVTAIAQSLSSEPVKTFNIRFEDAKFDESPYAKAIAQYLGTKHHEYTVTEKDAIELIPQLPEIYDEPFADSSAIPTLLVSKMARQNVTMTLSGDGGDELFMGYGAYRWAERLNNPFVKMFRPLIKAAVGRGSSRYKRVAHLFEKVSPEHLCSHIFSQEQYLFSRSEIKELLNQDYYCEFKLDESPALSRQLTAAEKQSLFDLKYYLKDDLLVKVDRASMHHSLETRVPLLDYRIVEFAFNLHPSLRLKGKTTKYLLKQVLYDFVPQKYFERPKWGFAVPLNKWMKTELKAMTEKNLSTKNDIFRKDQLDSIYQQYISGKKDYLYNRLWEVMVVINSL